MIILSSTFHQKPNIFRKNNQCFIWKLIDKLFFHGFILILTGCGSGQWQDSLADPETFFSNKQFIDHSSQNQTASINKVVFAKNDDRHSAANNNKNYLHRYLVAFKAKINSNHLLNYDHNQLNAVFSSRNFPWPNHLNYQSFDISYLTSFTIAPTKNYNIDQTSTQSIVPQNYALSMPGYNHQFSPTANLALMSFRSDHQAKMILTGLLNDHKIWYAEPDYISSPFQGQTPSDPSINSSDPPPIILSPPSNLAELKITADWYTLAKNFYYHINSIRLDQAIHYIAQMTNSSRLKSVLQGNKIIIAVMDSGVDIQHPALKKQIISRKNSNFGNHQSCKNDENGCNTSNFLGKKLLGSHNIYPVGTSNFDVSCPVIIENPKHSVYCRHGTHVSGIISGYGPGVFGVCPFCQILPIKLMDDNYNITDSSIIRGLQYIALFQIEDQRKVSIVNISLGKTERSLSVSYIIENLANNHNILFVAAAGNEHTMQREYPSALNSVLAVSAVDQINRKIHRSNFGGWIDISAPGMSIESSAPGRQIFPETGTSVAAPMVAGVAGLVLSVADYSLSSEQLRAVIKASADADLLYNANQEYIYQGPNTYKNGSLGSGMLNALEAVKLGIDQSNIESTTLAKGCGVIGSQYFDDQNQSNTNVGLLAMLWIIMFVFPIMMYFISIFLSGFRLWIIKCFIFKKTSFISNNFVQ